jgi:hypothetical protein
MTFTPFFVADRPVSLRILEGLGEFKGEFGILSHAFTSDNFKKKFNEFGLAKWKIGDSGIYQGREVPYEILFNEYNKMGVTHGIIKDYYRDPTKTLESAKVGLKVYEKQNLNENFILMGVAQGNTLEEYLENYDAQREMGYAMVAIGGLLTKVEKHKRMVKVKKEEFLVELVRTISQKYPHDKFFLLGAFSRSRIGLFKELNIWGADYKGWIFRYDIKQSHEFKDRFLQTRNYIKNEIFPLIQKNRLLIMSCSVSKRNIVGTSLEVYDGPSYKVVRKYLRNSNGLDIRIISAKYGLISKDSMIEYYDEKLTKEKALQYKKRYSREVNTLLNSYKDVLVFGSSLYRTVLGKHDPTHTEGRIGEQLAQLKKWLYDK